jgi:glycosyltransferase involved in cell wall biosynthesis
MPLRVTHCPVNLAGVGWTNVQALRSRGVDARLVVFNTQPFRPDQADWDLRRPRKGLLRQQAVQWRALAKLLPKTDIFHFYFGLTLVPKKLQFPILKATRKKSLFHFLGADIRERPNEELLYGLKADARVVGSFAALDFIPYDAEVLPPGIDLSEYEPVPPVERERVRVVHAPSNKEKKGTEYVIEACKQLPVDLDVVHGVRNEEALESSIRCSGTGTACSRSRAWRSGSRSSRRSTRTPSVRPRKPSASRCRSCGRRRTTSWTC